ncbi:MAG: hypothetical protein JO168_19445 [Solirubrobacterales bacterium]|nr:hypothetical protein [Solirubrobacterales bacterium]MBV9717510.1 hypothetical protein [Solirubrobacterales bacterium]
MFSQQGLESMKTTLAADGYELDAREEGERVLVTIEATPDACADCLAPPDVMRAILGKTLAVPAETIDLHYPEEPEAS